MTLLDLATGLNLALLLVVAYAGAPTVFLGLASGAILAFTAWPFDLTEQVRFGANQYGVVTSASLVVFALRSFGRLPVRDVRAFVNHLGTTLLGYGLWRASKGLYGPSLAYGDALVIDGTLAFVLVAALPAVLLLFVPDRPASRA